MNDWMKSVQNNGFEFLLIDLDVASTFMDVAEKTDNEETRQRNLGNARHAYDTVLRLSAKSTLDAEQHEALDAKLTRLKTRLEAVGQKF
jgi:hypothetical protein